MNWPAALSSLCCVSWRSSWRPSPLEPPISKRNKKRSKDGSPPVRATNGRFHRITGSTAPFATSGGTSRATWCRADKPQQRFGYQFVIFRVGLYPGVSGLASDWDAANLLMGHAAITDKSAGEHRFSEVLYREAPFLAQFGAYPDPVIAGVSRPWGRTEPGSSAGTATDSRSRWWIAPKASRSS